MGKTDQGVSGNRDSSVSTIDWSDCDPAQFHDKLIGTPGHEQEAARSVASYLGKFSEKWLEEGLIQRLTAPELAA